MHSEGVAAVCSRLHAVAQTAQHLFHQRAHGGLVFYQKDRATRRRGWGKRGRFLDSVIGISRALRQIKVHRGSHPRDGVNRHLTAGLAREYVDRQAPPRALPDRLGREEGLEHLFNNARVHAGSRVSDRQANIGSRRQHQTLRQSAIDV
ncbi:hypothetical protein G6F65_013253 [Rhizopus arrhizus]|nr:hypothetical protein G6F65_013253 [Rhizopus arrhizus]